MSHWNQKQRQRHAHSKTRNGTNPAGRIPDAEHLSPDVDQEWQHQETSDQAAPQIRKSSVPATRQSQMQVSGQKTKIEPGATETQWENCPLELRRSPRQLVAEQTAQFPKTSHIR